MKKKLALVILCFVISLISHGQEINSGHVNKIDSTSIVYPTSDLVPSNVKGSKDSIVISIQQFEEITRILKKDSSIIEDLVPSIIALIVVIISTIGAIYIGKKQINAQIAGGEEQLRSQESQAKEQLKLSREQIQESSKTLLKQINSENRQDWVIDTRSTISELLTQANLLNIEFQEKSIDFDRQKVIHEKFVFNKNKLFLLLKPEKESHKALLDCLSELLLILDTHLLNSSSNNNPNLNIEHIPYDNSRFMLQTHEVIESGRKLLYEEWAKIQSL
ncbi:MAG: hypothetical protein JXA77_13255 [Bacteroidales bacterium]|nr:hypothetical protein [Bacteroidales bacterium]